MNWERVYEIAMGVGIGIMAADVIRSVSGLIAAAIMRSIEK
jgi:hypothetical protein